MSRAGRSDQCHLQQMKQLKDVRLTRSEPVMRVANEKVAATAKIPAIIAPADHLETARTLTQGSTGEVTTARCLFPHSFPINCKDKIRMESVPI